MQETLKRLAERIRHRPWLRNTTGFALVFAGFIGPFMPVLGLWMIPLGLVLLSVDYHWAHRANLKLHAWARRFKARFRRR